MSPGVVFEESFLFSDSVRANIAYGRADATDAEVAAAARAAEADGFIMELPNGYDTVVGERGLTLSGGQRQRIALARALLTDPRILILDDATSSIASQTEEEIHATLRTLMQGRTTILVAHRRSTLRLASRIVVVDQGRVADEGTHDELIAPRLYRDLLAGPGDECEEPVPAVSHDEIAPLGPGGITPSAWPREEVTADEPVATTKVARPLRAGPGAGAMRTGGGMIDLAATPELLAALDRLPPVVDEPMVDVEREAQAGDSFRLRDFLRPYRGWLAVGFALVVTRSASCCPSWAGSISGGAGDERP
jgi:ATP-binding cassette subfamily B protein